MVESREWSYTTTYEYNYLKNLTKITDSALTSATLPMTDWAGDLLPKTSMHQADGTYGTWTYTYDNSGNLATTTDPKSQTIEYPYDDLNRVTSENNGGGSAEITYSYDTCLYGKGRICGATTTISGGDIGTNVSLQPRGRHRFGTEDHPINDYTTSYSYDWQGNNLSITYPDNAVVSYSHNSAGQLESIAKKESGESIPPPWLKISITRRSDNQALSITATGLKPPTPMIPPNSGVYAPRLPNSRTAPAVAGKRPR